MKLRLLLTLSAAPLLFACGEDAPVFPLFDVTPIDDTGADGGTDAATDSGGGDGGTDTGGTDATDDTGEADASDDAGGGDVSVDTPCPDADADGVCDEDDICPDGDDGLDGDEDGVPDACDACPEGANDADADEDGVPDACDACPDSDDTADADADGVPDGCDICAEGDDASDADEDGVPDDCDVCPAGDDAVDSDEDGTADACDLCEGSDDALDADGDGAPDACDLCEGFDDSADADEDGVPDACDICEGDDALCTGTCAEGAEPVEVFAGGVVGCAGSVAWDDRNVLCGERSAAATAEEWVAARGDSAPSHHYWTDDDLTWDPTDDNGDCSADLVGSETHTGSCPAGPMRVCTGLPESRDDVDLADPSGNTCTWGGCGWQVNEPNEFFGGCSTASGGGESGGLAGTLCTLRAL